MDGGSDAAGLKTGDIEPVLRTVLAESMAMGLQINGWGFSTEAASAADHRNWVPANRICAVWCLCWYSPALTAAARQA